MRKAAHFLRGLAPEAATAVLSRLTADEAAALRAAVSELSEEESPQTSTPNTGSLPTTTKDATTALPAAALQGVELHIGAQAAEASRLPIPPSPTPPTALAPTTPQTDAAWFESIRNADPGAVAEFLRAEHPRTAALVLSYLGVGLASAVVAAYPEEEQSRLLALLSEQGDADPESVGVIAKELAEWLRKQDDEKRRRADRLTTIRSIIEATPAARRKRLVERLREDDPDLVDELGFHAVEAAVPASPEPEPITEPDSAPRPPAVSYAQLERLDARVLARALGMLDGRTALLALAEASDPLLTRVESRLSRKAARELRRRLTRIGPTTLGEIDRAKLAFAYAAEQNLPLR